MRILRQVEKECGWMYETRHDNGQKGRINYVVWSDVFVCPECASEIVFWENAVDIENGKVLEQFFVPQMYYWFVPSVKWNVIGKLFLMR